MLVREVFPQGMMLVEENIAKLSAGEQEFAAPSVIAAAHGGPALPLFESGGALRALAINQVLPAHARRIIGGLASFKTLVESGNWGLSTVVGVTTCGYYRAMSSS
ncbi:MAG: hypothetical protein ACJ74Z_18675 [Bryobacteraceae bacterium]